jgi:hypothetical protein
MDWRDLDAARGRSLADYFAACLGYGQLLWTSGLAARALLAVDRGLLCPVSPDDLARLGMPLPYAAVAWLVAHTPSPVFIGNPRVHYQHLADRVRGTEAERKRWRAWACWRLVRIVRPEFPSDPSHHVTEPLDREIERGLREHGIPQETECWARVRAEIAQSLQNERTCPP